MLRGRYQPFEDGTRKILRHVTRPVRNRLRTAQSLLRGSAATPPSNRTMQPHFEAKSNRFER
jgi:hypothetical protein